MIGEVLPIRTVLEFGAGRFSTVAFLDKTIYPQVERVDSIEPDEEWRKAVGEFTLNDKRHTFIDKPRGVYDLVLVDSGQTADERVPDIMTANQMGGLTIIHDFDFYLYRDTAQFEKIYVYRRLLPWTAVCMNCSYPELEALMQRWQ